MLLAGVLLLTANARAPAQAQDGSALWEKAGTVARESLERIPRFIDTQIKFYDRRGRQTRNENGTIELSIQSDGSLQSKYLSKNRPAGAATPRGQSKEGMPPGGRSGAEAPRGGAPRGGPPGGGPPGAGMSGGMPPSGVAPRGGAPGREERNDKEQEKIAALTDGSGLLEMIRLVDPFSASALKEVEFAEDPQEVVEGGRTSVRLQYTLRQEEKTIQGEITVDKSSGSPLRCTALLESRLAKRSKQTVALQYRFDEQEGRAYLEEIALIETIRKGLFGREKIVSLYRPHEYFARS